MELLFPSGCSGHLYGYPSLSQRWLGPAQHRGSQERRHSKSSLSARIQLDSVTPGDSLPHLSSKHSTVWVRQRHYTTHSAWLPYLKQLQDSCFPNLSLLLSSRTCTPPSSIALCSCRPYAQPNQHTGHDHPPTTSSRGKYPQCLSRSHRTGDTINIRTDSSPPSA